MCQEVLSHTLDVLGVPVPLPKPATVSGTELSTVSDVAVYDPVSTSHTDINTLFDVSGALATETSNSLLDMLGIDAEYSEKHAFDQYYKCLPVSMCSSVMDVRQIMCDVEVSGAVHPVAVFVLVQNNQVSLLDVKSQLEIIIEDTVAEEITFSIQGLPVSCSEIDVKHIPSVKVNAKLTSIFVASTLESSTPTKPNQLGTIQPSVPPGPVIPPRPSAKAVEAALRDTQGTHTRAVTKQSQSKTNSKHGHKIAVLFTYSEVFLDYYRSSKSFSTAAKQAQKTLSDIGAPAGPEMYQFAVSVTAIDNWLMLKLGSDYQGLRSVVQEKYHVDSVMGIINKGLKKLNPDSTVVGGINTVFTVSQSGERKLLAESVKTPYR
ncbi:hypothetical protein HDU79_010015, partial [Rhizoclosmatium sp. JEL0117]